MSKDFFDNMEEIEKVSKEIKFLENSHPEITQRNIGKSGKMLVNILELKEDLKKQLKKIHTKPIKNKKV